MIDEHDPDLVFIDQELERIRKQHKRRKLKTIQNVLLSVLTVYALTLCYVGYPRDHGVKKSRFTEASLQPPCPIENIVVYNAETRMPECRPPETPGTPSEGTGGGRSHAGDR